MADDAETPEATEDAGHGFKPPERLSSPEKFYAETPPAAVPEASEPPAPPARADRPRGDKGRFQPKAEPVAPPAAEPEPEPVAEEPEPAPPPPPARREPTAAEIEAANLRRAFERAFPGGLEQYNRHVEAQSRPAPKPAAPEPAAEDLPEDFDPLAVLKDQHKQGKDISARLAAIEQAQAEARASQEQQSRLAVISAECAGLQKKYGDDFDEEDVLAVWIADQKGRNLAQVAEAQVRKHRAGIQKAIEKGGYARRAPPTEVRGQAAERASEPVPDDIFKDVKWGTGTAFTDGARAIAKKFGK